jgi:hypothetical protein
MVLGACGEVGVLLGEVADNAGGDFVVDYSLAVVAYDVDAVFLDWE